MWSWGHAQEAYDLARKNLGKKSVKFLAECHAEWVCKDIERAAERLFRDSDIERDDVLITSPFQDGRYEFAVKCAKELAKATGKNVLADAVWERAEEQATCDNGGYSPHMCPYHCGCHTVEW